MPRKVIKEEVERPYYIDHAGNLDISKLFKYQPAQLQLLKNVTRGGHPYVMPMAQQMLSTGGVRSGKTLGALMFFVQNYCLKYKNCNMLVLRRTFKDLEAGAISDFKAFVPKELFVYDSTKHTAVFTNGSKVVFGHCNNLKERDVLQYLGTAYPAMLVDECGQFSPDAWMVLHSRNTINAGCEPDEFGNMPIPCIWGCSNPIGPFYEFYRTVFVQKEPWMKPEDAKRDPTNGAWFVPEAGEWRPIYDPSDYAYQRTTVLDNPEMIKRDPGFIAKLNAMPKAKRNKFLLGLDSKEEGQYYDCWSEEYHTVNLREDPEAVVFQKYQSVIIGSDWGMGSDTTGSANASYFMTKALVKNLRGDYVMKTVVFQEIIVTGGKTYKELAALLAAKARYPDGSPCEVKYLYFSHEKFARQMDTHAPVYEYSKELRKYGLPAATPATRDRIGSASLLYNLLKNGEIVFLDSCREIILTIPTLMRDPELLEDVIKTKTRGDDAFDSLRYGLYGMLASKPRPAIDAIMEHAKELGPVEKHFYLLKQLAEQKNKVYTFRQPEQPVWCGKI